MPLAVSSGWVWVLSGRVLLLVIGLGLFLAIVSSIGVAESRAKWTVMVYMDADNNLEAAAILDLEEFEKIGSGNGVNIVLLWDRSPKDYEASPVLGIYAAGDYGSWSSTRVYLVERHPQPGLGSRLLIDMGEKNTGDPATLLEFVRYSVRHFPAEHYVLILWNHGSSVSIAQDDSQRDVLTLDELRDVLAKLEAEGIHIEVLGFDACLMSSLESMYAVADYVDYMVASEEVEPGYSWPFDTIMGSLVSNPSMTPRELVELIVRSYGAFYDERGYGATTLAAFDLRGVRSSDIAAALSELAGFTMAHPGIVHGIREELPKYGVIAEVGGITVDYVGLVKAAARHGLSGKPVELADKLMQARVASYAGPERSGSHGVSIFFPSRASLVNYYLSVTSLGRSTGWARAVVAALNVAPEVDPHPEAEGDVEVNEASGGGYELPSSLGDIEADGRPGKEIAVVISTSKEDGGDEYMASALIVVGLRGGKLVKLVDKPLEVARDPSDFIIPIMARSYDVDGDGVEEVYVLDQLYIGDEGSPETHVLLVDPGTGRVVKAARARMFEAGGLAIGDVNGDGKPELLVVGAKYSVDEDGYLTGMYGLIYILDARSLAPLDKVRLDPPRESLLSLSDIALADIDGDGVEEVLVSGNVYDYDFNHQADKDAVFIFSYKGGRPRPLGTIRYSTNVLAAGDMDNDKVVELVAASYGSCRLSLMKLKPSSVENIASIEFPRDKCGVVASTSIYDIDGDGVREVVVFLLKLDEDGDPVDAGLRILSFADKPRLEYSADNLFSDAGSKIPLATDINGDGRSDLVYISVTGLHIKVEIHKISNYVDTRGSLKGVVKKQDGTPIEGATVIATVPRQESKAYITETGSDGRFEFDNIPAASYEILVVQGNKLIQSTQAVVEAGKTKQVTIVVFEEKQEASTGAGTTTTTAKTATKTETTTRTTQTTTQKTKTETTTRTQSETTTTKQTRTQHEATTHPTTSTRGTASSQSTTSSQSISIPITSIPLPVDTTGNTSQQQAETQSKEDADRSKHVVETEAPEEPGLVETSKAVRKGSQSLYYLAVAGVVLAAAAYMALARRRSGVALPPPPPPT